MVSLAGAVVVVLPAGAVLMSVAAVLPPGVVVVVFGPAEAAFVAEGVLLATGAELLSTEAVVIDAVLATVA